MSDAEDQDLRDFQPPRKKLKSTLTPSEGRFKAPTSNEEMAVLRKGYIPHNTQKNTDWAIRVFTEWRAWRNLRDPESH